MKLVEMRSLKDKENIERFSEGRTLFLPSTLGVFKSQFL